MNSNLPNKILIVDADVTISGPLIGPFNKVGIEVFQACDLQTALYRFNKNFFRVVFIDLKFPELDVLSLIQKWRRHEVEEKRFCGFIITAHDAISEDQSNLLSEMSKVLVVRKPLVFAIMMDQIHKAYKNYSRIQLSHKIKKDILDKLDDKQDIKDAIKQAKEFRVALGDEYHPLLVELYQKSELFHDGIEHIKSIPPQEINQLKRMNLMGKFYLKLGNMEEAKKCLEEADKVAPMNMDRLEIMTDMYMKMRMPQEAIEKQNIILDMNPENPDMKFDMFKDLETHGFFQESIGFCQETSSPKEVVRYFNNKGVMIAQSEDANQAIGEYKRALVYYPKNPDNYLIHFNLALAYLRTLNPELLEKAKINLQRCIQLNPNYNKAIEMMDKLPSKEAS